MFSGIRKFLGAIKVTEEKGMIYIEGLPSKDIANEIYRIWSTSKITNNIFTKITSSSVSFNSFFAPDILYTLETIYNGKKGKYQFRILGRIIELLYENTWLGRILEPQPDLLNFDRVKELNITLLEHQDDFLNIFNSAVPTYGLRGYILGAVPGSGKTLAGLSLACCLESEVVICIVPKNSVNSVWVDTIATRFVKEQQYWASTMNTDPPKGKRFYVFHYEQIDRAVQFFGKQKFKKPLIILDESHNMNEITSARTQALIRLSSNLEAYTLWTSGTPLKALGKEVIPILKSIAPDFNPDAEARFLAIFGKNSTKATDILRNRIGQMTFRVDKAVVVANQVETIEKKVVIPNGDKYTLDSIRVDMRDFITIRMKYYQENMKKYIANYEQCIKIFSESPMNKSDEQNFAKYKNYIKMIRQGYDPATMKEIVMFCNNYELKEIVPTLPKDLKDVFKACRSVVKYYQLKVQGEALGRILGKMRAQCHVDMVPYSGLEEMIEGAITKTVIFTSYVEVVDATANYLQAKGYSPLRVYGDTNHDLTNIIKLFKDNIDANPLIATFQSLSTAVPLVMANQAILMNSPFRTHEYQQATARVDRIGQIHPVRIINIFLETNGKPNISTRSGEIMEWSKEQVEAMLGTVTPLDMSMECFADLVPGYTVEEIKDINPVPSWASWARGI
jgi:SNF2 family DNA or RNA helicase